MSTAIMTKDEQAKERAEAIRLVKYHERKAELYNELMNYSAAHFHEVEAEAIKEEYGL